jgi:hypothetical protein
LLGFKPGDRKRGFFRQFGPDRDNPQGDFVKNLRTFEAREEAGLAGTLALPEVALATRPQLDEDREQGNREDELHGFPRNAA